MSCCRRCPTRRGFTLVEALVVVAILGVLIAVLLPAFSRARQQVSGVVCQSSLKQLMHGMHLYIADHAVFPGTHSLFYFQSFFGRSWPRIPGVTWDGARDRLVDLQYTAPYVKPYHLDAEFVRDVPGRGTLFPYVGDERVYTCPSDRTGQSQDSPGGGGGNGRLSFALNAYVGYQSPDHLAEFRYVAPSLDNPLPRTDATRSFAVGERVTLPPALFQTMFEEHPAFHINAAFPEGNFNGLDRITTRHRSAAARAGGAAGRVSLAYLDGHVAGVVYPEGTDGRRLFTEFGQPHYWHQNGTKDRANIAAFIRKLPAPCPW